MRKYIATGLILIFGFKSIIFLVKKLDTDRNKALAYYFDSKGDLQNAHNYFNTVYNPKCKDIEFILKYGKILEQLGYYEKAEYIYKQSFNHVSSADISLALARHYENANKVDSAVKYYEHAHYILPNRFIPLYLLTKLYIKIGETSKSDSLTDVIIKMPVKVNSPVLIMMREELNYRKIRK